VAAPPLKRFSLDSTRDSVEVARMPCRTILALVVVVTACTSRPTVPPAAVPASLLDAYPDTGSRLLAWPLRDTATTSADVAVIVALQNGLQARPIYLDPTMFGVTLIGPAGRLLRPVSNGWWEGHRGTVRLPGGAFYGEVIRLGGDGPTRLFDLPAVGTYRVVMSYHAVPPPPEGPPVTDRAFPTLDADTVRITYRPEPAETH
jgi:hypothetical protein